MIELQEVAITAGTFSLHNVQLFVPREQYTVLMGRSGEGKTTILEAICGLRKISRGRILLHDTEVTNWLPGDRQLGYVPQDLGLFPNLTVEAHLQFAMRLRRATVAQIRDRTSELAELLGLTELLGRYPRGLSGGEAQRVALGRALSFQPAVLLLDEPLGALDDDSRDELIHLLKTLHRQTRVTVLHVTHSQREADQLADVIVRLHAGKLRGSDA